LDDLLAVSPELPMSAPARATEERDADGGQPVFELAETETSLPMVETGTGEPPSLSVEAVLGSSAVDTAPADTLHLELQDLGLTDLADLPGLGATEVESPPPTPLETEDMFAVFQEGAGLAHGEDTRHTPDPAADAERFALSTPDVTLLASTDGAAAVSQEPVPDTSSAVVMDPSAVLPTASSIPAQMLDEVAPAPVPLAPTSTEMAAMREAVTERVAQDLRRELGEKLLDRFEKIVWEVVPDLAEILITREIERIRRMAEEERAS
jgi:hypothetical protein